MEGGARGPGRPHTGPAGPSVPSQTAASLSTSDQLAGRQPGVTWAVTLLPDFPSPAPAGLPVTSPGSSALGSAAAPVTPPEATCPAPSGPTKGSTSSLPLVTIRRRAGLPPGGQGPRVCPWHLPSDASMCSRPGVGSVNRKLTVTWRERLVLRAWGDLVRSSQGTRGWPRPVRRQKQRWGLSGPVRATRLWVPKPGQRIGRREAGLWVAGRESRSPGRGPSSISSRRWPRSLWAAGGVRVLSRQGFVTWWRVSWAPCGGVRAARCPRGSPGVHVHDRVHCVCWRVSACVCV